MFGVSLVLGHLPPLYAKVQFETVYVAEQQDKISSPSNNPKVRMGTSKEYHYLLKEGKCNTNIFYNYCVVYPYKQFRYYPNTFPLPKRR